jgi:hypothetical protein
MASNQTLKCSGQAGSKGRALFFLVSQPNLNASSWGIWRTKNCPKLIRNEKIMVPWPPKVEGVKNSKKFLNTQTILFMLL